MVKTEKHQIFHVKSDHSLNLLYECDSLPYPIFYSAGIAMFRNDSDDRLEKSIIIDMTNMTVNFSEFD
jgi:hypothetical protein